MHNSGPLNYPALTGNERERATLDINVALQRQDIDIRSQMLHNQQHLAAVQIKAAEREFLRSTRAKGVISTARFRFGRWTIWKCQVNRDYAWSTQAGRWKVSVSKYPSASNATRQRLLVEGLKRRVADLTIRSPVYGK